MNRARTVCLLWALLSLTCGPGASGKSRPDGAARVSATSFPVPACVEMTGPKLVVLVRGLVDLASEDPYAGGVVEQDDVILALVEARQGLKDPCPVRMHKPKLECFLNCRLEGPNGTTSSLDLADSEIEFPFHSSQKVKMHHETLDGLRPDPSKDQCSLGWLPSASQITGYAVKASVFGRPDPALVTSRIVFGTGEVFAHDFWLEDNGSGDTCLVVQGALPARAMAKTLGIVVPLTSRQVPFRRIPAGGYAEDWWVEAVEAGKDVVVTLRNHADEGTAQFDFTGHYRLLDGDHADCNAAPKISPINCAAGLFGLDPQCSPSNSQWP